MRWFIEVSSVEGGESDAQYCVDAKQWQSALQQARKLRGDAGPLSTFSIELLDNGYRAVDRKQKLRYVVKKAPNDAPLNDGKNGAPNPTAEAAAAPQASEPSVAPGPTKSGPPPRPRLESARPSRPTMSRPPPDKDRAAKPSEAPAEAAPAASKPSEGEPATQNGKAVAKAAAPAEAAKAAAPAEAAGSGSVPAATTAGESAAPAGATDAAKPAAVASAGAPAAAEPGQQKPAPAAAVSPSEAPADDKAARVQAIMGQSNAPRAPSVSPAQASAAPAASPSEAPPPSVLAESVPASQAAVIAAEVARAEQAPPSTSEAEPVPLMKTRQHDATPPPADPSAQPVQLKPVVTPDAEVIRARGEEPTKETPITYRELALAVKPGTSREGVEALLWERYRALTKEIEARPRGKFVQLAVFDHVFSKKPLRPPLALFLWKDWRGDPLLSFPGFKSDGGTVESPKELKEKIGSLRPTSVIPIGPATSSSPGTSQAPGADQSAAASTAPEANPAVAASPSVQPQATQPEPAAQRAEAKKEDQAKPAEAAAADASAEKAPGAAGGSADPVAAKSAEPAKQQAAAPSEAKQPAPQAEKGPRRRIGEDLIGDLFESMHELHFMADVVAGADFVLSVLADSLPSQLSLVHVFDINNGKFVVVRQTGGKDAVLMHQTPDSDSFVHGVMKAPRAKSITPAGDDDYFKKGRWQASGVEVRHVLSGAVRQGGRYLGLIELANPIGTDPYHESEANALDYICEQFAEFLVNRPIVLDADVILRKS